MATHGPCETEGPGLLPYEAPSGIEDITARGQAPAAPAQHAHGTDYTKAGRCRACPGDNGRSRTGMRPRSHHFISSRTPLLPTSRSTPLSVRTPGSTHAADEAIRQFADSVNVALRRAPVIPAQGPHSPDGSAGLH